MKEPRPPNCVCCEYMFVCEEDRGNGQKADYCPDPEYRRWIIESGIQEAFENLKG